MDTITRRRFLLASGRGRRRRARRGCRRPRPGRAAPAGRQRPAAGRREGARARHALRRQRRTEHGHPVRRPGLPRRPARTWPTSHDEVLDARRRARAQPGAEGLARRCGRTSSSRSCAAPATRSRTSATSARWTSGRPPRPSTPVHIGLDRALARRDRRRPGARPQHRLGAAPGGGRRQGAPPPRWTPPGAVQLRAAFARGRHRARPRSRRERGSRGRGAHVLPQRADGGQDLRAGARRRPAARRENEGRRAAGGHSGQSANALAAQLDFVGRCVKAGVPTRVYLVSLGGFDTHANEKATQQQLLQHPRRGASPASCRHGRRANGRKVVLMAYSEFGRRVAANASDGTDHGTAGPVFVAGRAGTRRVLRRAARPDATSTTAT